MAHVEVPSRPVQKKPSALRPRGWSSLFLLLLAFGLACLALYLFSPGWLRSAGDLPVGLRSPLRANYAMDSRQFSLAPVRAEILGEALFDRREQAPASDPNSQLVALTDALGTPVPSITPLPGSTSALAPQTSPTMQVTASPLAPTATPEQSASLTPTPTVFFTAVPTLTFRPYDTATYPVVTVVVTYWSPTSTATRTPTKTEPAPTQAATKTLQPTIAFPTATAKATATLAPILSPSPMPSVTSAYPPPPPPPTAYP